MTTDDTTPTAATPATTGTKDKAPGKTAESTPAIPSALDDIAKEFKKTGAISGSNAKKLNTLVPDLTERLKANATKSKAPAATKAAAKPTDKKAAKTLANAPGKAAKVIAKKAAPKAPMPATSAKGAKSAPKPVKAETPVKRPANGKYPRHPKNPFRDGSSYALAFDVLASNKKGMNRADLTKEYSKVSKKPLKNAGYDIAVLLSPKSEKATSERHKSCREGFGVRRENDFVQIILPGKE